VAENDVFSGIAAWRSLCCSLGVSTAQILEPQTEHVRLSLATESLEASLGATHAWST
jgi:hypothetical protein